MRNNKIEVEISKEQRDLIKGYTGEKTVNKAVKKFIAKCLNLVTPIKNNIKND